MVHRRTLFSRHLLCWPLALASPLLVAQVWSVIPSTTPYSYQDLWFNAQQPDTGVTCGYYIQAFDILPFGRYSADGGITMAPLDLFNGGTFLGAFGLAFTNGATGYMCGGGMLKTTDGGQNWVQQMDVFTVNGTLYDVHFPAVNDGYAVGESWNVEGMVMVTHNGGSTWDPYTVSSSANNDNTSLTAVARSQSNRLYAGAAGIVVGSPTLFLSTDDGPTWTPLSFSTGVNDLCSTQGDTIFAATDAGIYRITTSGTSIVPKLATTSPVNSLDIRQGLGYAVCADGSIHRTLDGGETWTPMVSPVPGTALNAVRIVNAQVAYACGEAGTLLRCDGFSVGLPAGPQEAAWTVLMDPTTGRVEVMRTGARASYRLLDASGRHVQSGALVPGVNMIDLSGLVPGVYTLVTDDEARRAVRVVKP